MAMELVPTRVGMILAPIPMYFAMLLVPTRVGMILIYRFFSMPKITCPHTRGDDPDKFARLLSKRSLSPHAWG